MKKIREINNKISILLYLKNKHKNDLEFVKIINSELNVCYAMKKKIKGEKDDEVIKKR